MNSGKYILLFLMGMGLSLGLHPHSKAQEPSPKKPDTQVELVASTEGIQPGQTLKLGIHFKLKEGWHTYWKNPGDSGQALQVQWSSNPLVRFAPLEYPYPEWIPGKSVVSFGYHDQVTFLTQGFLPPQTTVGENLIIQAQVKWLVCEEICIPEQKTLQLKLPIVSKPPLANLKGAELINSAQKKIPKALVGSRFNTKPGKDLITLQIPLSQLPQDIPTEGAKFFPMNKGVVDYGVP
ncbi:MAG: protein-disulfide reductase DsbD family protein, partial [bacterium]|nr:protein-disulfide reductase DsbD family protein [bacterium]